MSLKCGIIDFRNNSSFSPDELPQLRRYISVNLYLINLLKEAAKKVLFLVAGPLRKELFLRIPIFLFFYFKMFEENCKLLSLFPSFFVFKRTQLKLITFCSSQNKKIKRKLLIVDLKYCPALRKFLGAKLLYKRLCLSVCLAPSIFNA